MGTGVCGCGRSHPSQHTAHGYNTNLVSFRADTDSFPDAGGIPLMADGALNRGAILKPVDGYSNVIPQIHPPLKPFARTHTHSTRATAQSHPHDHPLSIHTPNTLTTKLVQTHTRPQPHVHITHTYTWTGGDARLRGLRFQDLPRVQLPVPEGIQRPHGRAGMSPSTIHPVCA